MTDRCSAPAEVAKASARTGPRSAEFSVLAPTAVSISNAKNRAVNNRRYSAGAVDCPSCETCSAAEQTTGTFVTVGD